ncbi:MAG: hypothetical protein Q9207_000814 [Kuettlingeria erythrocarpa]
MASAIKSSQGNKPIMIDWEDETAVPDEMLQHGIGAKPASDHHTPSQIVILTGATGFLGKEILRQLFRTESIRQVHCIAVRDPTKLADFSAAPRLQIHKGDLRNSLCGLYDAAAQDLFDRADLVIHNGADVSFLKSYHSLRAANVGLRSLATTRDKKHVARALDMPTGMLLITCYVNLTRFCRSDQEIIFARLPDLVIAGVSLQQDGLLQILVLIQVVSGMLDALGTSLGYLNDYRILTGSLHQRDTSSTVSEKSTTPKLTDLVMNEDEMSKVQDASGGGIKALREENWELKKLIR